MVGTNQTPEHPENVFAVVTASFLKHQILETSLLLGATIQAVFPPVLQSKKPQARLGLEPNGAEVSKVKEDAFVPLTVTVADVGQIVDAIPTRN